MHVGSDSSPESMRPSNIHRVGSHAEDTGKNGVNVKVIVRCRPFSDIERKDPTQFQVVSAKTESKEVQVSQTIPGRKIDSYSKTFTFDGVCNQYTTQEDLFITYIVPIVEEVLLGFNCTIFAYGQTGTGKTYTMEGDIYQKSQRSLLSENKNLFRISSCLKNISEESGVIPRAVQYIFEALEAQNTEYSVRVSYLEIYNEELNDLLNDGDKQNLRIFEDPVGKKGLSVDRLEEIPVNNPQDIFNILTMAVKKRRTAETLLNRQSSRSHCIFSVMIHMKETNIEGEDIIKIGKLNLVDLAGSENIQRSGAIKDRAKEAGMINQSLLTLGRVINALVEHSNYVPYRDSKLTRLLQESLGGRTKTCIVATISPSSLCLEETLSTLDYAFRAKNIRNRPEINQKMTKRVMIRELNYEIEKLKLELQTNREKNGVYLPIESFAEIEVKLACQKSELSEASAEITKLKNETCIHQQEILRLKELLNKEIASHKATTIELTSTKENNSRLTNKLQLTATELKKEKYIVTELRCWTTRIKVKYKEIIETLELIYNGNVNLKNRLEELKVVGEHHFTKLSSYTKIKQNDMKEMKVALDFLTDEWNKRSEFIRNSIIKASRELQSSSTQEFEKEMTSLLQSQISWEEELKSQITNYLDFMQQYFHEFGSAFNSNMDSILQSNDEFIKSFEEGVTLMQTDIETFGKSSNLIINKFDEILKENETNYNKSSTILKNEIGTASSSLFDIVSQKEENLGILKNDLLEFQHQQCDSIKEAFQITMTALNKSFEDAFQTHANQLDEKMKFFMTLFEKDQNISDHLKKKLSTSLQKDVPKTIQTIDQIITQSQTDIKINLKNFEELNDKHQSQVNQNMTIIGTKNKAWDTHSKKVINQFEKEISQMSTSKKRGIQTLIEKNLNQIKLKGEELEHSLNSMRKSQEAKCNSAESQTRMLDSHINALQQGLKNYSETITKCHLSIDTMNTNVLEGGRHLFDEMQSGEEITKVEPLNPQYLQSPIGPASNEELIEKFTVDYEHTQHEDKENDSNNSIPIIIDSFDNVPENSPKQQISNRSLSRQVSAKVPHDIQRKQKMSSQPEGPMDASLKMSFDQLTPSNDASQSVSQSATNASQSAANASQSVTSSDLNSPDSHIIQQEDEEDSIFVSPESPELEQAQNERFKRPAALPSSRCLTPNSIGKENEYSYQRASRSLSDGPNKQMKADDYERVDCQRFARPTSRLSQMKKKVLDKGPPEIKRRRANSRDR